MQLLSLRTMRYTFVASLTLCAPTVRCFVVTIGASLAGLQDLIKIDWEVFSETADSYCERLRLNIERMFRANDASHLHDGGILLHVSRTGDVPVFHGMEYLIFVDSPSPGTWVSWSLLPAMLHELIAKANPDLAMNIETYPYKPSDGGVGMFLLQSPGRLAWRMLARTLRAIWITGELPASLRLHVLVHNPACWVPNEWLNLLGEAAPVFGGIHWCSGHNRFPMYNPGLYQTKPQDNYYNKVFMMLGIAQQRKYTHLLSVDDDVFLSPGTLAYLVGPGVQQADAHGCGVIAPLLQNGVPSVELWAEDWLYPREKEQLYRCFSESSVHFCDLFQSAFCSPGSRPSAPYMPLTTPRPWDAIEWYAKVSSHVPGDNKGLHPVRANATCMELALKFALEKVRIGWVDDRPLSLMVDSYQIFPYLCNNVFLLSTSLYERVIRDPRLKFGGADEVVLNRVLSEMKLPLCFVKNSFGVHPAYSTHPNRNFLEKTATEVIEFSTSAIIPFT